MRHRLRAASTCLPALLAGVIFCTNAFAASANGYRVLHHESVDVKSEKGTGATEHMSFEAYGRRFELTVTPNERIRRGMPANLKQTVPLAGSIDGIAGSWARVTRSPSGLRGMLFDGHDIYAIEPAAEVAPVSVEPMSAGAGDTVVYRLSDALMPVETMRCEIATPDATPESPATAADALQQLSTELHTFQIAAVTPLKQVRVGVVGDFEFVSQFTSSTPEDAIVARMNIVDGIFTSQLGVKVSLATQTLFRTASDPFTQSAASDLLTEVKNFRNGSQAQKALGITHLMTGRHLDKTTVGIAYIGGLCSAQFGASLSQGGLNTTQAALIAAHEIGHNFGAPHDGETGACSATPTTFLMAPQLNGSDQFSACSIQQITPVINNANCLTAYIPPDASVEVANGALAATVGTPLVASFTVRATGDDASANVNVTILLPIGLTLQSASANGGTCTSGAGTASCSLGTLAAGDARQIDLNVTPTQAGALALNFSVSSSNDPNAANDNGAITINASGTTPPPPPGTPPPSSGTGNSSGGGGGGGGSLDLVMLAMLGATLAATSLARRRRSAGPSPRRAAWAGRALRSLRRPCPLARRFPSSSLPA